MDKPEKNLDFDSRSPQDWYTLLTGCETRLIGKKDEICNIKDDKKVCTNIRFVLW